MLTIFAVADAWRKVNPVAATSRMTRNAPVPGPSSPSYRPITTPPTIAVVQRRAADTSRATRPSWGRSATKIHTSTRAARMSGPNTSGGRLMASRAPTAAPPNADRAMGTAVHRRGSARRPYVTAAAVVPMMDDNLLVPRASAGRSVGATSRSAGNCRRPPPPLTASTQPAAAATQHSRTMTYHSGVIGAALPPSSRARHPAPRPARAPPHPG